MVVRLSSFGHCVVCPSMYGFWLPLWYLHTLLKTTVYLKRLHHVVGQILW